MKQGILYKNEQGQYALEGAHIYGVGDTLEIFDEDLNSWIKGSIQVDAHGEYYFVDDEAFMVIYLYEGLLARVE